MIGQLWTIQEKKGKEWVNTTYNTCRSLDAEQALGAFRKAEPDIEYRIVFNDSWHHDVVWKC